MAAHEAKGIHGLSRVGLQPIPHSLLRVTWLIIFSIGFFAGVPFTVAVIQIPQRYQTVGDTSALTAGIRLLPFTLCTSVGIVFANVLASKLRVPYVFVLLLGAIFQITSTALMSELPTEPGSKNYGYEVLLALGLGLNLGMLVQLTPQLILGEDQGTQLLFPPT